MVPVNKSASSLVHQLLMSLQSQPRGSRDLFRILVWQIVCENGTKMRYCEMSKEMSSLYFGLDVFYQFEARVPEFDYCSVFSVHCTGGGVACQILGLWPQIGRITASPKYNEDISLLISQCLISDMETLRPKILDHLIATIWSESWQPPGKHLTKYSADFTSLWKEATAAMTALVYFYT
jgi:hypothetical protein